MCLHDYVDIHYISGRLMLNVVRVDYSSCVTQQQYVVHPAQFTAVLHISFRLCTFRTASTEKIAVLAAENSVLG